MTTFVVGLLVGALAMALNRLLRPPTTTTRLRTWHDPPAPASPGFLEALGRTLAVPVRGPSRFEIFVGARAIVDAMVESIDAARERVDVLTFIMEAGDVGTEIADALRGASTRGARCRLIVDGWGSVDFLESETCERCREDGVEVAVFNPPTRFERLRWNRRTHRKIALIDDAVGFTGGIGFSEDWLPSTNGAGGAWREFQFRITGPALADLAAGFEDNWRQATGDVRVPSPAAEAVDTIEPGSSLPMIDGPGGETSAFHLALWMALEAAHERVRIRTPYLLPDTSIVEAVRHAHDRGVRVDFLVASRNWNDSRMVRWASPVSYDRVLEAGGRIWEYGEAMMHAKTLTADGALSIIGSHNVDLRSMMHNFEMSTAIWDEALARELDRLFDEDLGRSEELTRREMRSRPPHRRLLARVVHAAAEQL